MKNLIRGILLVLTLAVLWLDFSTPVGLAVWVLYYLLLMATSYVAAPRLLFVYASIVTLFIILGGFFSTHPIFPFLYLVENRASAIIVLWVLTFTFYRNRIFSKKLQEQQIVLSNANKDLESFNYTISHDLKNPLVVIGGFGTLLQESAAEKFDEEERFAVSGILKETQHMKDIIADLLRLSKITKQEIIIETVDMSNIAQNSFDALSGSSIIHKHYHFHCQADVKARADPGLMRILFDNLLGNAIKFSSRKDSPLIEFGRILQNDKPVYFVKDNGAGFDANKAARIFEPFTRLHSASEFPGTGIGLSIVKKIIDRHHGTIRVESKVGEGTVFYFTLLT